MLKSMYYKPHVTIFQYVISLPKIDCKTKGKTVEIKKNDSGRDFPIPGRDFPIFPLFGGS